jgi:hypothetical protein
LNQFAEDFVRFQNYGEKNNENFIKFQTQNELEYIDLWGCPGKNWLYQ